MSCLETLFRVKGLPIVSLASIGAVDRRMAATTNFEASDTFVLLNRARVLPL